MMNSKTRRRKGSLAPNPRMWAALKDGDGLTEILTDFYNGVYQDPRLAPFFTITKQRAIEQQYAFLKELFTGERIYFGERPRNAHNWMIISNELFDYREALMERSLRRYGLAEDLIATWRKMEETFRKQIVKSAPFPKMLNGVPLPLEGWAEEVLSCGSLCDGCGCELASGLRVTYHVRKGTTYCAACAAQYAGPQPAPPTKGA